MGGPTMRKRMGRMVILLILGTLLLGCAGMKEEAKSKCPECGTLFKVETNAPTSNPVRY